MKHGINSTLIAIVFGSAILAGCAGNPARSLPPVPAEPVANYQLGAGDHVRIVVYGHENVPTDYVVDDQGDISFPLASRIEAGGQTTQELEDQIARRLQGVVVDPSVSVQVMQARPFYVSGGVNKAGAFPYSRNMTVEGAVAMAEGFTDGAYDDQVRISRLDGSSGKVMQYSADMDDFIRPDDMVYVYEMY